MNAFFRWISQILRRFTKGVLLIVWIYVLCMSAMYAASNSVSKIVFEIFDYRIGFYTVFFDREYLDDPSSELRRYLRRFSETPPPIESVIEQFLNNPHWSERDIKTQNGENDKQWKRDQYRRLFEKVDQRLSVIALDETVDPKTVKIDFNEIIPSVFVNTQEERVSHNLPKIAINWVVAERPRIKSRAASRTLIDTFVLLMVLGAFGSLIFLTRDYIVSEEETSIETYIFRPILGMFLAIAMFIVDIAAHSLISTSNVLDVRKESKRPSNPTGQIGQK